jgi:hypothetical protein
MTPVIFISFLFSLVWVDYIHMARRTHFHTGTSGRMPHWLHHLIYREKPYQFLHAPGDADVASIQSEDGEWYYHTKQRKLMKLEVAEAFQIRTTVLVILGAASGLMAYVAWRAGAWIVRLVFSWS